MKKFLCVICCVLVLAGCGTAGNQGTVPELLEPVGINIDTCKAEIQDIINETVYYGHVIPGTVKLYFTVDGTIKNVPVFSGKWVEKGEVLLSLDVADIEKQIEDLDEQIQNLKDMGEYDERIQNIRITYIQVEMNEIAAKQGSWTNAYALKNLELQQAVLDQTHAQENRDAQIAALELSRDELNKKIEQKELIAPVSGYIYFEDQVMEGAGVHAGSTVMYLLDPKDMRFAVDAYISEYDFERFPVYAWINGKEYEVSLIVPSDDELRAAMLAGETLKSEFRLPGAKDLKAGDKGAICIRYLNVEGVLALPKNAVQHDEGGKYVHVIYDNGTREKRYIETGRTNNIYTEIKSGLEEGETVYVPD